MRQKTLTWEAWQGVTKLSLKLCELHGAKIKPAAARLAEFNTAPLHINEQVRLLTEAHSKEHEASRLGSSELRFPSAPLQSLCCQCTRLALVILPTLRVA